MTWKHVIGLALASVVGIVGAVVPGAQALLIPLATGIVGGVFGHAQGEKPKGE
jgi:hypothetical protein